jgi:hypothetical protein
MVQSVLVLTKKEVQVSAYTSLDLSTSLPTFDAGKNAALVLKSDLNFEFGPIIWPDLDSVLGNVA